MGWFQRAKPTANPMAANNVWIVGLHIRPGKEPLPASLAGAYVSVFCGGENATYGAWAAIQAVEAMGYSVPEAPAEVHMITAAEYEGYVARAWPELKGQLPDQATFYGLLADNRVVLGPFAGYEHPSD